MFDSLFAYIFAGTIGTILLLCFLVYWFSVPFLCRWVAIQKGYSSTVWFWLSFLFGVFALWAISVVPPQDSEGKTLSSFKKSDNNQHLEKSIDKQEWQCPNCNKRNPNTIYKCEHCGYSVI